MQVSVVLVVVFISSVLGAAIDPLKKAAEDVDSTKLGKDLSPVDATGEESDDINRKKKSTTTLCVEIRPSNPYQRPFQVCEPEEGKPAYGAPMVPSQAPNYYPSHEEASSGYEEIKPTTHKPAPAYAAPSKSYSVTPTPKPAPAYGPAAKPYAAPVHAAPSYNSVSYRAENGDGEEIDMGTEEDHAEEMAEHIMRTVSHLHGKGQHNGVVITCQPSLAGLAHPTYPSYGGYRSSTPRAYGRPHHSQMQSYGAPPSYKPQAMPSYGAPAQPAYGAPQMAPVYTSKPTYAASQTAYKPQAPPAYKPAAPVYKPAPVVAPAYASRPVAPAYAPAVPMQTYEPAYSQQPMHQPQQPQYAPQQLMHQPQYAPQQPMHQPQPQYAPSQPQQPYAPQPQKPYAPPTYQRPTYQAPMHPTYSAPAKPQPQYAAPKPMYTPPQTYTQPPTFLPPAVPSYRAAEEMPPPAEAASVTTEIPTPTPQEKEQHTIKTMSNISQARENTEMLETPEGWREADHPSKSVEPAHEPTTVLGETNWSKSHQSDAGPDEVESNEINA